MIHYAHTFRTRGYDTDRTATVPIPKFLSYLEHARWEWLLDPRAGFVDLIHDGHFFVVLRQKLELIRRVGMSHDLTCAGHILRIGRSTVDVEHRVTRDSDGARVARAIVVGAWLGPNRRLARIPNDLREMLQEAEQPAPWVPETFAAGERPHGSVQMGEISRLTPPEHVNPALGLDITHPTDAAPEGAWCHSVVVRPSQIDIFDHVNAATYLRYMDDARILGARRGRLPERADHPSVRVAIAYDREALVDDVLDVRVWPLEGDSAYACVVQRGDERPLCRARVDVL